MQAYAQDPWPVNGPLFTVSPERQRCMDAQVSLCPRLDNRTMQARVGSGDDVKRHCGCSCCNPIYTGGYNDPFPSYAPFQPDNAFFSRQDFPQFSFLPKCSTHISQPFRPPVV